MARVGARGHRLSPDDAQFFYVIFEIFSVSSSESLPLVGRPAQWSCLRRGRPSLPLVGPPGLGRGRRGHDAVWWWRDAAGVASATGYSAARRDGRARRTGSSRNMLAARLALGPHPQSRGAPAHTRKHNMDMRPRSTHITHAQQKFTRSTQTTRTRTRTSSSSSSSSSSYIQTHNNNKIQKHAKTQHNKQKHNTHISHTQRFHITLHTCVVCCLQRFHTTFHTCVCVCVCVCVCGVCVCVCCACAVCVHACVHACVLLRVYALCCV